MALRYRLRSEYSVVPNVHAARPAAAVDLTRWRRPWYVEHVARNLDVNQSDLSTQPTGTTNWLLVTFRWALWPADHCQTLSQTVRSQLLAFTDRGLYRRRGHCSVNR